MSKENTNLGIICEQGDMGLHYTQLTESEQRKVKAQEEANKNSEKKNR